MSVNIFVKLQTPTIELPISAKDSAGNEDKFIAGFKRYNINEAKPKLEELQNLQTEIYFNTIKDLNEQYKVLNQETVTNTQEPKISEEVANANINLLIKNEIVYLKNVNVTISENGIDKPLKIADTRTAKPNEPLWLTPEECLSVLIDSFLACAAYRGSLIDAQQKALANVEFKDAKIKN
jgi:hypothetical protein